MARCILMGADEEVGDAKEVEAKIYDFVPKVVNVCPYCGCRHFKYSLLVGIGVKRFCLVCDRIIEYRERD
jgi:hypothetical protein